MNEFFGNNQNNNINLIRELNFLDRSYLYSRLQMRE